MCTKGKREEHILTFNIWDDTLTDSDKGKVKAWVNAQFSPFDFAVKREESRRKIHEALRSNTGDFLYVLSATVMNKPVNIDGQAMTLGQAIQNSDAFDELEQFMSEAMPQIKAAYAVQQSAGHMLLSSALERRVDMLLAALLQ